MADKRTYPEIPRVGVGGVILQHNKLLLAQRQNPPAQGKWTLPGGLIELGESPQQALKRELREETGLVVEITHLIEVVSFVKKDAVNRIQYHYILLDYACVITAGQPRPGSDVLALQFVDQHALQTIELPEITRAFLQRNQKTIFSN